MVKLFAIFLCFLAASVEKPRIFVTDHDGFEANGQTLQAGVRRVNAEQIKSLNQACPDVVITSDRQNADFVVVWDNKTWAQTSWAGHQNEFTVYAKNGDLVKSGAAHKISNAAKDICAAVAPAKEKKS